ncbi:hypothetical protein DRW03_28175 [Corallococcus sp. H22C18031201]|nr:hypothetical protein DRW03_28175 [Corallococcus sp. H22C18031201]
MAFSAEPQALPTDFALSNLHVRQQIFRIVAVDSTNKMLTLDKPLEYGIPVTSSSDGSAARGARARVQRPLPRLACLGFALRGQ